MSHGAGVPSCMRLLVESVRPPEANSLRVLRRERAPLFCSGPAPRSQRSFFVFQGLSQHSPSVPVRTNHFFDRKGVLNA
jgi:hypothetical protein